MNSHEELKEKRYIHVAESKWFVLLSKHMSSHRGSQSSVILYQKKKDQSFLTKTFTLTLCSLLSRKAFSPEKKMDSNVSSPPEHQKHPTLQQSFSNIQTQCSDLLNNLSKTLNPLFNPNSSPHHPNNIFSALDSLRAKAKQTLDSGISRLTSVSTNTPKPVWARISDDGGKKTHVAAAVAAPVRRSSGPGLSDDDMEERLAGVPVYALSNSNEEFVLVSGTSTGKSLGLLFCKEEDAEALLNQMKIMDPRMKKEGSKVVALALSKVKREFVCHILISVS